MKTNKNLTRPYIVSIGDKHTIYDNEHTELFCGSEDDCYYYIESIDDTYIRMILFTILGDIIR